MEPQKKQRHAIRGVILKDDELYAPLNSIIEFCRRFPKLTSYEVASLIEDAQNRLKNDEDRMSQLFKVKENKSWFNLF